MEALSPVALDAPFEPLVRRILEESTVIDNRILKIDHFLNHRIEPDFMGALGRALAARVVAFQPALVLTAEASGIAPALATASALGLPLVYAKKYAPASEVAGLSRVIGSPTKGGTVRLALASRFVPAGARVVLIDDFLANGGTALALAEMVGEAGAQLVAAGFVVEKCFQGGRAPLEERGIPVATLARILRFEDSRPVIR